MRKKEPKKSKEFSKDREFGVILERIHSDIKIICEDLSTLKSRVEGIATNQAATLERIASLEITLRRIQADVAGTKVGVQVLKEDVSKVKTDIAEIKTDFGKRLTHLETSLK